jgi:hypothetical protein
MQKLNTRKIRRKQNKSKCRYKKRGGNADLGKLFMNTNPLETISQIAGITR